MFKYKLQVSSRHLDGQQLVVCNDGLDILQASHT
jgi:hypothetical protein